MTPMQEFTDKILTADTKERRVLTSLADYLHQTRSSFMDALCRDAVRNRRINPVLIPGDNGGVDMQIDPDGPYQSFFASLPDMGAATIVDFFTVANFIADGPSWNEPWEAQSRSWNQVCHLTQLSPRLATQQFQPTRTSCVLDGS